MSTRTTKWMSDATAAMGSIPAVVGSVALIVGWGMTGPIFDYSSNWQLVINTTTTIITFIMVFIIQNTQNRDSAALHAKLDAIINATAGVANEMEHLEEEDLQTIREVHRHIGE